MLDHISSLEVEQYIQNKQTKKLMKDSSHNEKTLSDKPQTAQRLSQLLLLC